MRRAVFVILLTMGAISALIALALVGYFAIIGADASSRGALSAHKNVTAAMEPSLLNGDWFTSIDFAQPGKVAPEIKRGDLVLYSWPPDTTKHFVKRVVGLPGDTLSMKAGILSRNGNVVSEGFAWHESPEVDPVVDEFGWQRPYLSASGGTSASYRPSRNEWGPIVVPPDSYFVLGDNRDNSLDSRYWGFVATHLLVGKARRVYFSRDPSTGAIRWRRLGHALR